MTHVHVVGTGIVGERIARMCHAHSSVQLHPSRSDPRTTASIKPGDIALLAHGGRHADQAIRLHQQGVHVVTVGDTPDDTHELVERSELFDPAGPTLVAGAAMSPGLSGLIARYLASTMASADEVHIAVHGTAGAACARQYHRSLGGLSAGVHGGQATMYVAGSGRELCYFPEPVGPFDCYRARTSAPLLLHRAFPELERCSIRRSARRRDRFTAWLPMLRPPHREGGVGALRVEVRGYDVNGGRDTKVAGIAELVGTASAATAAACALAIQQNRMPTGMVGTADSTVPTDQLLGQIAAFGVRLQIYTGEPT